jgi:hypothetical protein
VARDALNGEQIVAKLANRFQIPLSASQRMFTCARPDVDLKMAIGRRPRAHLSFSRAARPATHLKARHATLTGSGLLAKQEEQAWSTGGAQRFLFDALAFRGER